MYIYIYIYIYTERTREIFFFDGEGVSRAKIAWKILLHKNIKICSCYGRRLIFCHLFLPIS